MPGDVVVVGAGLSGLVAAVDVQRAGRAVTVLEAADRIGGKVLTRDVGGVHVDFGAHWIGADQSAVIELAERLHVDTAPEPVPSKGADEILSLGGRVYRHHGDVPPLSPRGLLSLGLGLARMGVLARRRQPDDEMADVLARRCFRSPDSRRVLDCVFRLVFGADPADVPARAAFAYMKAAGSIRALTSVKNGAQERFFVDGTYALVDAVAQQLSVPPRTGTPVAQLRQDDTGVDVVTTTGTVRASAVIVAVPLPVASSLEFDPPLSADVSQQLASSSMGDYAKTFAVYDTPWWRAQGLTGTVVDADGPIQMVVDGNAASSDGPGVLVSFSAGRAATELFSRPDRRDVVIAELVRLFGPAAASPMVVDDFAWSEQPWLLGAPTAIPARGRVLRSEELRHGRIHWAGADLADRWPGYLDGAVRSGRRAAADVLATFDA
ncbi:flavin monoamine oxidase family protein [Actinomycetes bacterium M1A6_2h]